MQTILFVIPSLDYGGAARQLTLIAEGLPRDRFRSRVCVLGQHCPWAEELRAAGVEVDILGWKRPFEAAPFFALRRLLAELRPDVVHCWGRTALRAVAAVGGVRGVGRLFVSAALPSGTARPTGSTAGCCAGPTSSWRSARRRPTVAVALASARSGSPSLLPACGRHRSPPTPLPGRRRRERLLLGVGPIEPHKGFRDAVWALDILHYLYDDLRLVLAGDGSDRPRLEEFARATEVEKRVVFLGRRPDLAPWLHSAELVWIPSRTGGGVCAALEAMAAGRPVIATRLPDLAEVVADGVAACLVPPGDKTELARQTRFLLNDPDRRRAYGEAGRRRAAEHFSVEKLVQRCATLYEDGSTAI